MGRRLAVGVGVTAGTALLVVGVGSAGLFALSDTSTDEFTTLPTATPSVGSAHPTPTPPTVEPVPAEIVLAEQMLDPAALPVHTPARAAVVVEAYDDDGERVLLAFDADAARWVRLELLGSSRAQSLVLSPDGRAVLRQQYVPGTAVTFEVVTLATAVARSVPVPVPGGHVPEDCWGDAAAWASNERVGIVSGCLIPNPGPGPGLAHVGTETWVHEVDLPTGDARAVEAIPDSAPLENYPAYSPDGRYLAYGIGYAAPEGEEEWETLRVTQVDGAGAQERYMTHIVYGDPWVDSRTVLGREWIASIEAADFHVRLDAQTGETTPLGVEGLANAHGIVGGRLVAEDGPWSPETARVTFSVIDLGTGEARPWLAVPDGYQLGTVSVAREVVAP